MAPPGPRVTILPIPMNLYPNGQASSVFPTAPSAGYDTGSPGGTFTAWSTAYGVQIPNPANGGNVWLYYWNGVTAAPWQVLIGDLIGNTGAVAPATTEAGTIAASSSGWLGPGSPATYNQQAPASVTYAGAINTQALTAAAVGCVVVDFSATTTLSVRAYSVNPISP
jgi:hypothetical protein